MPTAQMMAALFQKATAQGSRSTVLKPLGWLIALCVTAILGALKYAAPAWLLILFGVCSGASVALYFGAYIYCLKKDPELLRTENYLIQK